jgi:nucleoside-diphosphate-sugar epimerase
MPETRATVLVTGSSGFIGAALLPPLAELFRVVGFDEGTPPYPPPVAECVCLDLTSDAA